MILRPNTDEFSVKKCALEPFGFVAFGIEMDEILGFSMVKRVVQNEI